MNQFLGETLFPDAGVLVTLLIRLTFDLLFAGIVIQTYLRFHRQRTYVFTYVLLNIVTFALGFLLSRVPIQLGFAVGLFGVFGILRYRTEAIPVRDLTYLFAVIGIGLLNALSQRQITLVELLLVNIVIGATVVSLERMNFSRGEQARQVIYDRLDLLAPDAAAALLDDLRRRTRLPITRFEVGDLDLLKDTAAITVYYPTSEGHAERTA